MKNGHVNGRAKRRIALAALVLAVSVPFVVLAETSNQTAAASALPSARAAAYNGMAGRGRMGVQAFGGIGMGGYGMGYGVAGGCAFGYSGIDTASFNDEQKAVYQSAAALYEQVEDAVLSDLVTANVLLKADVDAYQAQRTALKSLAGLDQTNWTADQYKAFYEANAKTGDDRKAAMQALADAELLTQVQADALSAQGQSELWKKVIEHASTNSAVQTAVATLRQARQTLMSTLRDAGIDFGGAGMMNNGFGMGMMNGYTNRYNNFGHMNGRMGNWD